jgi:hypothetical protein
MKIHKYCITIDNKQYCKVCAYITPQQHARGEHSIHYFVVAYHKISIENDFLACSFCTLGLFEKFILEVNIISLGQKSTCVHYLDLFAGLVNCAGLKVDRDDIIDNTVATSLRSLRRLSCCQSKEVQDNVFIVLFLE